MMASYQQVHQFKSRIDFDDPTTTKPPSLAKSAVLQALEEDERQQARGKGWQQRLGRSRQREPAPVVVPRTRTPCINRDTVLRINRRLPRHRSCDSFWPPLSARSPSPLDRQQQQQKQQQQQQPATVGGSDDEGGSFAYCVGERRCCYGSNESVYFDERVRKQHKIDPLRTMFDKANVVLVDWGRKGNSSDSNAKRGPARDETVYDRHKQEKVSSHHDAGNSVKQGGMIGAEAAPSGYEWGSAPKPRPPSPPPRRYFLPMDQLPSDIGMEILLRCGGSSLNRDQSQAAADASKINDNSESAVAGSHPALDDGAALHQDGIQSKPPLKIRSPPAKRPPSKPSTPAPLHGDHNFNDFNINSNTILNLNIDNAVAVAAAAVGVTPRITVTDCQPQPPDATTNHFDKHQPQQQQQTVAPKTNDQLLNEIIDENHNYNEKLITSSDVGGWCDAGPTDPAAPERPVSPDVRDLFPAVPNEQHSKLNVSNQPNRNWINLNSNEIYPRAGSSWDQAAAAAAAGAMGQLPAPRMTVTRVRADSTEAATSTNDGPRQTDDGGAAHYNYDNKSVKSDYWEPVAAAAVAATAMSQRPDSGLRRSDSRDSTKSWRRAEDVLEFPPPPAYVCECQEGSSPSGRCSEERTGSVVSDDPVEHGAQICDNRRLPPPPVKPAASETDDKPTMSQSCRQQDDGDVWRGSSSFGGRHRFQQPDTHPTPSHNQQQQQQQHRADDYFKTNLTDDKFLSDYSHRRGDAGPCNLTGWNQQQQQPSVAGREWAQKFDEAQNFNSLHKSIDANQRRHRSRRSMTPPAAVQQAGSENSRRQISFTDGEYIFGPYDEQSEEFARFDLWSHCQCRCHHHQQCGSSGCRKRCSASDGSSSGRTLVESPRPASGCRCSTCSDCQQCRHSVTSSGTLKECEEPESETRKTPESRQLQVNQAQNNGSAADAVPAGNVGSSRPPAASYYQQPHLHPGQDQQQQQEEQPAWARFEAAIASPATALESNAPKGSSQTPRRPTPYPSPTDEDHPIFDQFAAAVEKHEQPLVENVPLIDAVLDDLLTFSKTLVLRQSCLDPADSALAAGREEAKIVEINDDNLINLLADDDNSSDAAATMAKVVVPEDLPPPAGEGHTLGKTFPSSRQLEQLEEVDATKGQENSGDESFREQNCDQNTNEQNQNRSVDDSRNVLDNYLSTRRNQEDLFANVAIFNWNPLDVYQQHGLFMIDPRFALADMHASTAGDAAMCCPLVGSVQDRDDTPNGSRTSTTTRGRSRGQMRNDAHLNSPKREQAANDAEDNDCGGSGRVGGVADDDDDTTLAAAIGIAEITDGTDPSSGDVNSFATQRALDADAAATLLESHKIPNDSGAATAARPAAAVDHFYDSAHVEYPVWPAEPCPSRDTHFTPTSTSSSSKKECSLHQSTTVESDYDNDPTTDASNEQCQLSPAPGPGRKPGKSSTGPEEEGLKRVAWPPPLSGDELEQQNNCAPQAHYQQQPQYHQQQQPHQQQPSFQPHYQPSQQHQPVERIIPIQRPDSLSLQQPQYQPQATQAFQPLVSQQQEHHQQPHQTQLYQHQPEAFNPQQQHQQQLFYQQPDQIPFVTTLRKEPPMSQEPAPVYQTQPVAAIYQGGTNMRGDQKWPPAEYKKQSELENEERRRLAQQPAFRPRKIQKDYSDFFSKNALNATYPGYRAPPGTQHHS